MVVPEIQDVVSPKNTGYCGWRDLKDLRGEFGNITCNVHCNDGAFVVARNLRLVVVTNAMSNVDVDVKI